MDAHQARALRQLLLGAEHAALGTLHQGEPAVSMVPYALMPQTGDFVIHVSRLATHTQDMQRHAGVSLMVTAERAAGKPVQALPRVSLAGSAAACPIDAPEYAAARAAYLERFAHTEPMFDFADFSLVIITPRSVRMVEGFGQAWSVAAPQYRQAMAGDT